MTNLKILYIQFTESELSTLLITAYMEKALQDADNFCNTPCLQHSHFSASLRKWSQSIFTPQSRRIPFPAETEETVITTSFKLSDLCKFISSPYKRQLCKKQHRLQTTCTLYSLHFYTQYSQMRKEKMILGSTTFHTLWHDDHQPLLAWPIWN